MSVYRFFRCSRCGVRYSIEEEDEVDVILANGCKVCGKGAIEEEAHD